MGWEGREEEMWGVLCFCLTAMDPCALLKMDKTWMSQLQDKEDGQNNHLWVVGGLFKVKLQNVYTGVAPKYCGNILPQQHVTCY